MKPIIHDPAPTRLRTTAVKAYGAKKAEKSA